MRKIKGISIIVLIICFVFIAEYVELFYSMPESVYGQRNNTGSGLKGIYLDEGEEIDFSKDIYSYIVDVESNIEELTLKARPEDENSIVRINGAVVGKDEKYKQTIKLDKGKNKIVIQVSNNKKFENDENYKIVNKKRNITDDEKEIKKDIDVTEYTVYVFRGGKDAVYLDDFTIDNKNVGFASESKFYNLEIDEENQIVQFEFSRMDENDTILVNNNVLEDTDVLNIKFKGIGKYPITIDVIDNDTQRKGTYVINIYYGIFITPNVDPYITPNQWFIINGRWRYNDSLGNPLKNVWFYDSNYNGYFYFDDRGNMKTGWIIADGNNYYLNSKGIMQTGWVKYENEWYYLDSNGVMRKGWVKYNNNWYYMDNSGAMKTGWVLLNNKWYYLNKDGQMKTGWMLDNGKWYYLSYDGSMKTGWLKYNDEWYYLNGNGSMKSREWLEYNYKWYYINYSGTMRRGWLFKDDKYYYLNDDGSMQTDSITIDGYLYNFNKDGSVSFDE